MQTFSIKNIYNWFERNRSKISRALIKQSLSRVIIDAAFIYRKVKQYYTRVMQG